MRGRGINYDTGFYGVLKLGEDGVSWEPKEVFRALASAYA
jgi:hypothetical protein